MKCLKFVWENNFEKERERENWVQKELIPLEVGCFGIAKNREKKESRKKWENRPGVWSPAEEN